jgi:hypothetical protein
MDYQGALTLAAHKDRDRIARQGSDASALSTGTASVPRKNTIPLR